MLKPKSPQESFYGSYLYDRIVSIDHLLRKINQVVDFSFARQLFEDRYHPDIGRPAEDPEFMLRLCLLQYIYGDSDRQVVGNARLNLSPTSTFWAWLSMPRYLITPRFLISEFRG
jgi:transposase